MSLSMRWAAALADLRRQGRYRELAEPRGLDFASNDYLGLASECPAIESPLSWSGAASRLLRGHHPVWVEVEERLAAWHRAEAVLMMNSGYAANEGLLSTLIGPDDWVASDEMNHASIVDGLRLARCRRFIFRHNDLGHLEDELRAEATRNAAGCERFIVTESLFSMDGDRAPLGLLVELAERYGAHVIVDEAHATGCFGPAGSGLVDAFGLRPRVLASVHTGGKALALPGAYIVGSALMRDYLVNRCRHLMFTTALPPAVGAWWQHRLTTVQQAEERRRHLFQNAQQFRELLDGLGLRPLGSEYIVPLLIGAERQALTIAQRLQEQGFDVRAIRPPSVPPGTSRLRIAIHATHLPDHLSHLANLIDDEVPHG